MFLSYRILLYGILFIFKVKTFLIEAFKVIRLRCYSDKVKPTKRLIVLSNSPVETQKFICFNIKVYDSTTRLLVTGFDFE